MMPRIKLALQIAGVAFVAIGILCLPMGFGDSPKRDLSAFANLADIGMFLKAALFLVPLGFVVLVVGCMLPGGEPEDML